MLGYKDISLWQRLNFFILELNLFSLEGDVESNPGPPKKGAQAPGKTKEPTKEEQMKSLQDKVQGGVNR